MMMGIKLFHVGLILVLASGVQGGCRNDYSWWGSFDKKDGLSKCSNTGSEYIRGFFRNDRGNPDEISLLEEAVCCTAANPFVGDRTQVYYANWWTTFDENHRWNICPPGYFLQGLYRTGGASLLWNIEEGRCMKPASHPNRYGHCYDHSDMRTSFDSRGTTQCNENYFVTGLYRGGCDQLLCIENMRCCKMVPQPDAIDSLTKAKTRVMDNTMAEIAYLAHNLGYGWCGGCRGAYVGEDFRRNGDTWLSDLTGPCSGYMNDQRLGMNYGNWKFSIKRMTFGEPVLQDLRPETVDTGVVRNNFPSEVSHALTRASHVTRTVTHTTTSSWRRAQELGVTIGYTPGLLGGVSASTSFHFTYETSSSTTDSSGSEQTESFSVDESIVVPPYHAVNYTVMLSKTRRTVPYTATVLIHFSTELRGFLRWGGGRNGASTNYHHQHRGSGDRPTFNYRFGGNSIPFYEALKDESDALQYPWLWADVKARYPNLQGLINSLASEGRYEFTLTGKFDDVSGKDLRVQWDEVPFSATRRRRSSGQDGAASTPVTSDPATPETAVQEPDVKVVDVVAHEKPGDPASVFPPPPVVQLDPDLNSEMPLNVPMDGN